MKKYILAIDQGTSGTKAVLFDAYGKFIGRHNESHHQFYPKSGWVEHDAEEIFEKTILAISNVLKENNISPDDVAALAISNQRETAVVWDRNTGKPVYNAVVWQCSRGKYICDNIEKSGGAQVVMKKTGLRLSPYFSAAKIAWILENVEMARDKANNGSLICGTIDSWLIYKLSGMHVTDFSNASRTQLFNIHTLSWDDDLLNLFKIPHSMLPEVLPSNSTFGLTDCGGIFKTPIPICGVLGDSHAALFGQTCFEKGMAKCTMGTGSSVMMNIGQNCMQSETGIVTSIAWCIDDDVEYVFEGNINYAGATIKWLVNELQLINNSKESGKIAASVDSNGGVYIVPAFSGLGPPYWKSDAKAVISGLTSGSGKNEVVRAAEESIAYQIRDILDVMQKEAVPLKELRVDGGPSRDDFLLQFLADMTGVTVVRNKIEELSAAGAAYMAGLSVKFWNSKQDLQALRSVDREFKCSIDESKRRRLYAGWKEAVSRAIYKPGICGNEIS